jgi:RecA/RadA recombinase
MKKYCANCRIEFEAKRETAKYCSDKCRVAAAREDDVYDAVKNLAAFKKMGMEEVQWITTGIPEFDTLTQIPRGRVTQIQGPYAVGKTTLCLNMIKGLKGHRVLYIDTEAALNPQLLVDLEVEAKNFTLYNSSAFIEDIYEIIIAAVEHARYDMIILDSLAATTFRTEAANNAADSNIGQKAKIVNKLMRIVPMELKRTNTALVIINQEREIIGGYVPTKYTPGGMGVPYGASLMVALKTTKGARFPKTGPPFKGHEVTAEIIKSKVNDPWRKATFKLYYGGNNSNAEKAPKEKIKEGSNIDSSSPTKAAF